MKKTFKNKKLLWIIAAAAIVLGVVACFVGAMLSVDNGVSQEVTIAQAQEMVDKALGGIAKSTASGAKYILENSEVTVNSLDYGKDKDIILSCSYTALDAEGALSDKIDSIMQDTYRYYVENTEAGKKINATKINLLVKGDIVEALESASQKSGEVTLYIYETTSGLQLYLNNDVVDQITGGLITVTNQLKNTNTVEIDGEVVDITNKNTLRTGITDCIALENFSTTKPVTGNVIEVAWADFKDEFRRNFIVKDRWQYLLKGLGNTLTITFLAAIMGILLGFLIAIIRCTSQMTGKLKFPDMICRVFLTITRGTPVMVQLLILFFVFLLPLKVDKLVAAVICFGLNSSAYVAEIVRGGIMSVDKGQIEAGRSLGFNYVQTMFHFVVPQAFKAILPSLANEFITLLKESSVAFYIGVADLTQGGLKIRSITYSNFMPLIAVAAIYLVMVMIMTKLVEILERRLAKSDH